jgi:hypothetical protein
MSVASDAISTELTSDYQTRQRIQVDTDSNLSVACANPGVATVRQSSAVHRSPHLAHLG